MTTIDKLFIIEVTCQLTLANSRMSITGAIAAPLFMCSAKNVNIIGVKFLDIVALQQRLLGMLCTRIMYYKGERRSSSRKGFVKATNVLRIIVFIDSLTRRHMNVSKK